MPDPALETEDRSNTASLIVALAGYAATYTVRSDSVIAASRDVLIAALARGFEALREPECAALIGPLVPGALMPGGARVPGTSLELDPAQAAFCTGLMLCWSPVGSHWAALHSGRAADPIGPILAVADYQARKAVMEGKPPPKVRDVLAAIAKALEIQGVLAAEGGRRQIGTGGATIRVARVGATAVVTAQLGGALKQIVTAVSYACLDGAMSLDAQEEQYDLGREDWARADAMGRAVRHACQAIAAAVPSAHLTTLELKAVESAGSRLGGSPATPRLLFGTEVMDRLAALRKPQTAAQLTIRFQTAVDGYFPPRQAERIKALFAAPERLDDLPVNELLAALVTNGSR